MWPSHVIWHQRSGSSCIQVTVLLPGGTKSWTEAALQWWNFQEHVWMRLWWICHHIALRILFWNQVSFCAGLNELTVITLSQGSLWAILESPCDNSYISNVNGWIECKLQFCIDSISHWYNMNKLCINKSVLVIGSKPQLLSLNLDYFAISLDAYKLSLPEQVRYLELWVQNDLSLDNRILSLCKKNYCSTFTSPMYSLRLTMGYLYGVVLLKLT